MAAAPDARGGYRSVAVDTSDIDTLKAAKQLVSLVDEGAGGKWKSDRHAPGDGVTRAGFICNNHVSCNNHWEAEIQQCYVVG